MLSRYGAEEARRKMEMGAVLLDVREDQELRIASVKGALHIPMGQVPQRLAELPKDREILCMCHHGMRSEAVAELLLESGFTQVANLEGGIAAWSADVDPSVPQY